ncbi:MmgE/PrpD family protein, partial [Puniceibacterium confluentis]
MKDRSQQQGITQALAAFAVQQDAQDIPQEVMAVMRLSLLDWIVVGCAGRDEPVAASVRALARDEGGAAQAHALGMAQRVPARMAALVNGTVSHALDYDDTHFAHIGHPSVAVVPAALAMAERIGASGPEFQAAALIGCEASVRVGLWLGRGHYQAGFHQTATAGAFGAGLAAGRLLRLDPAQMADVLGLLATRASGLKSQFGSMAKPFNAGIAAANGVEAALLVHYGLQPRRDALEVAQGFGVTHHGAADHAALDGLGTDWHFDRVSHKFHACCHGLHAALEALKSLGAVRPDAVARIRVSTHPRWLSVCNITSPTTGLQSKFSYAQVMAMHLLGHDTARLDSYTDALCA